MTGSAPAPGPVPRRATTWQEAAARQGVVDTANRYAWAFDARRIDLLTDVFTSDVRFQFTVAAGPVMSHRGRDPVLKMLLDSMPAGIKTRHLLTGAVTDLVSEQEATLVVTALVALTGPAAPSMVTGTYTMRLVVDDDRWRITELHNVLDTPMTSPEEDLP